MLGQRQASFQSSPGFLSLPEILRLPEQCPGQGASPSGCTRLGHVWEEAEPELVPGLGEHLGIASPSSLTASALLITGACQGHP